METSSKHVVRTKLTYIVQLYL